jgi:hypothetical protein
MYAIDDVLRKKESQAEKLRQEIEALRLAAHIMEQAEDHPVMAPSARQESAKSWP